MTAAPFAPALNKKSLHAVVDHLLAAGGDRTAIEEGDRRFDYAALDRHSRALAHRLAACGVGPGAVVALPLPAGAAYVVALLATVRAGGIFLPLDPAYPPARLRQILELAPPRALVVPPAEAAAGARVAECAPAPLERLILDLDAAPAEDDPTPLPVRAGDDDTGYLIHTSGSTGVPKLIAGRNKGISHFVHWEIGALGLDGAVRASFLAPPGFDVSLREIFVPLLAGGTLVVPDPATRGDADRLAAWLRARAVTLLHATPSLFRLLTRALRDAGGNGLPALRHACLAGEPLYGADVHAWRALAGNDGALINLYGPSETTLAKAFHRVDGETYAAGAIVPLGQPIANSALLILRDGQLAGIGELGEIHIRTPFASNGYWHDPQRTAEAFIVNPLTGDPDDRIYRTGDLGRYRPDRSVEFAGRADRQVKVDGVRIELAEIEGALRGHPAVEEAAAHVFRLADGGLRLVGYYTGRAAPAAEALRAHLATTLPAAMIPGHLMALPALPKNLNGKVDRKALPRPDALLAADRAYSAPQGPVETALAALWAEALAADRVGAESPWLAVGGNSLRAIGLIGRINREFGVALTIRDFLEHGTVRAQARLIETRQADGLPPPARLPDDPAAAAAGHPATDGQRRLWLLSRLDGQADAYANLEWLTLDGPLDADALEAALGALIARHEALRTAFVAGPDGAPRQHIHPAAPFALRRGALAAGDTHALHAELARERATPFDLTRPPLLRATLLREAGDGPPRHHLLINMHHIACDGWSMGLLVAQLAEGYRAARDGLAPAGTDDGGLRPRDIAHWQAELAAHPLHTRCRDYWRTRLADADQRAILPGEPEAAAAEGGDARLARRIEVPLPAGSVDTLRALLGERQATPFMAVAAALAVLLERHGDSEHVVIGIPVAGRDLPDLAPVVGFFVNTLPLVLRITPDTSFAGLLAQTGRAIAGLHEHQWLPFDRLAAEFADAAGDPLANPLFEVFLAAEPAPRDPGLPGITVTEHEPPAPPARYDLTLRFSEDGAHWRLCLEYRSSLWPAATMQRLAGRLAHWLAAAAAAPDLPLAEVPMLDADTLARLEAWAQGPSRPLPDAALGDCFARQAARTPEAAALHIACGGTVDTWSYGALDARANAFATALAALGPAGDPGRIIGLLLPRGADWPAALLGILKAGATVLPLDPRHPPARLAELLADAGAGALITPPGDALPWPGPRLDPAAVPAAAPAPDLRVDPDAPAYLIYTSGSTGTPKGVLVAHRAFANMIADQIGALGVGPGDRVLQFVSPAFDVALYELFLALASGAALAVPAREEAESVDGYARVLARLQPTVVMMTPGFLHALGGQPLPEVRLVITGGEPPIADDIRRCLAAGCRYVNAYGPTETAVNASFHEVTADPGAAPVPLGRPTANTTLRVLAPDGSPLPEGVAGELQIGGAGVALGYLHRAALTARAFGRDAEGNRHYRSGDRARREADGSLVFLGRRDGQVKIRGHRVETGEVEAAIRALPEAQGIAALRVVARPAGHDRQLVAYWLAAAGSAAPDTGALARALAGRLPAHALPDHFVRLERFPLTANGKLDIARLPDPRSRLAAGGDGAAPPRDATEAALCALWRTVLDLPETVAVGRDSDFFALGGRSLAANRLALAAARALDRPVGLRDLYAAPTPAGLAARIGAAPLAAIPRLPESASAPLSPMQRRLWVISRLGDSGGVYHISGLTRLDGPLDHAALAAALTDLATRQSVLRSRIVTDAAGEPRLVTDPPGPPPLYDETAATDPAACAARPFDLEHDWPLRLHRWQRGPETHDLLVVLHHLAADGWSMPILVRELAAAYRARRAGHAPRDGIDWPPLPAQYRDLAAWMDDALRQGAHAGDAAWWREQLAGELPVLDLPADRARPPVRRYRGATLRQALPPGVDAAIAGLAAHGGVTPFAVFLAAVQTLLARLARQDELIVGIPVAGRAHPAAEGLIGFFVNTLPLRLRLAPGQPFAALLADSAARLAAAQQRQAYPFDRLVEDLALARDTARNPVFDVLVSEEGGDEPGGAPPAGLDGLRATALPLAREGARCDLWWRIDRTGGTAELAVEYDSDLFDAATVADWCTLLCTLLTAAQATPAAAYDALPWLTPAARAGLLAAGAAPCPPLPAEGVAERFAAVARAHPAAIALRDDTGTYTYAELDAAANRIATRLAARLPAPGATDGVPVVALFLERGSGLVAAQLAAQKAGAAYLPIEPDCPPARAAALLADARAAAILASPGVPLPAEAAALPRIDVPARPDPAPCAPPDRPPVRGDDPLYVMYTSGSTGQPKGVVVSHRAVLRLVTDSDYYRPAPGDCLLQLSNYAFDGATFDCHAALLNGLPLALPDRETVLDSARLAAFIARHGVNVTFITTALFNRLTDEAPHCLGAFRRLYFGGQEASLPHVRRAFAACAADALVHVYGPTEVTTFATWHPVGPADLAPDARRLPIGRPLANTGACVVDGRGEPQPAGVPGELWLGGAGVAHGYLGQPERTAERFVEPSWAAGSRHYRSGDLCRMRRDGAIEFLGRLDGQVKIRGYRVELGEIESRLAEAPGVGKAHVVARPRADGNRELVAYLTAAPGTPGPTLAGLHAHLARWLPPYMIPAHCLLLPALPVNANGKVEARALPAPEPGTPGLLLPAAPDAAPRDAAGAALAAAWCDTLGLPAVGPDDNYFALGGDSIQALRIVARLREAGWTLKVTDLLRHPTIGALAPRLERAAPAAAPAVTEDTAPAGLLPIQRWFLAQAFARPAHFNQSLLLRLDPAHGDDAVQAALGALWRTHPALRLTFTAEGGQRLLPAADVPRLIRVDCPDAAALAADAAARQGALDPARGPLLRAVRYRLPDGDRLFLCAHHWIIDGVSWRILLEDLAGALAGRPPEAAGTPLAVWAERLANDARWAGQAGWWAAQATLPALPLAADLPEAPPAPLGARIRQAFVLDPADSATLTGDGHTAYRTRGDELLLAAWVLARLRHAGADPAAPPALRLDLESHGRAALDPAIDVARTVGWFTSLFPVRFAPPALDPPTLIRAVKETLRAVPDLGLGHGVLRWLREDPALAAAPPVDTGFNYLGRFDADAALPVASEPAGDDLAPETVLPHALDVTAELRDDGLHVALVADPGRLPPAACAALAGAYAEALASLAAHLRDPASGALSPSDVDVAGLDLATLDAILDGLGEP